MENRTPLIAGNWKMFKTNPEAKETAKELVSLVRDVEDREVMIAPPFTSLEAVSNQIQNSVITLGAQNVFWEKQGPFTGEISAHMLSSVGCKYVIIGHSERRQYFSETEEDVNKKILSAIQENISPVMCVGETENEREAKETFSVLDKQVKKGLEGFSLEDLKSLVIAYEPVWAIGTGKAATSDQAQKAHAFIRYLIEKYYSKELAKSLRILYGGSVKPDNVKELMALPDVDGALVGGASLDAETFNKLIHF